MVIVVYVVSKGAGVMSWSFLTKNLPIVTQFPGGGIAPAIVGTLVITGVAALIAIPLGVLAAVYLNEYGRQSRIAQVIRFMADVMTGVPSIVMGLFVATIWVSAGLHLGYSGFAGSLALAALMLPIVIRSCEEMLKLVPDDLRQASDALGARRWRTVVSVVIPAALPGNRERRDARCRARRGRDRAAALHDRRHAASSTPTCSTARTPRCRRRSGSTRRRRSRTRPDRAWGAALTLIVIVFVCTVIARFVVVPLRGDQALALGHVVTPARRRDPIPG